MNFKRLSIVSSTQELKLDSEAANALLATAISQATEQTLKIFQSSIDELTKKLSVLETPHRLEEYKPNEIIPGLILLNQ